MGLTLTPDEVRRITLRSQGFLGAASRRGGIAGMLNRVGGVQLDTISVLARSHELVAYARLGPIGREMKRLVQDPAHIDAVLADGAARASAMAGETLKTVKDIVGFVRR